VPLLCYNILQISISACRISSSARDVRLSDRESELGSKPMVDIQLVFDSPYSPDSPFRSEVNNIAIGCHTFALSAPICQLVREVVTASGIVVTEHLN
jgi:hypothetical protein